jgi:6-phosphogluconolactonase
MRTSYLRISGLSLLTLLLASCGSNMAPKGTPVPSCIPSSSPEFAYVLSFADSNTISIYSVNSCNGDLTPTMPASVSTGANSFGSESMVVDPKGRFAYVANLGSNATDLGTISMFTIDSATGILTPTTPATVPTGFLPQGIGIDPSGKFVYTANSDDNTVSMFTINSSTGILTPTSPPTVPTGMSPLSITVDPTGRFAYAANQDDSTVSMYTVNSTTGVLTPTNPASISAGPAPFGVTIDPSGRFAYVPDQDFTNTVSEFTIDQTTGVLTQTVQATAPTGMGPTSVAVDPSGKFAYVANRGDNTVSMFIIDSTTGDLTANGTVSTGIEPFLVVVDPSGKFAYVSNESGSVSAYTLNTDGTLAAISEATSVGAPLWIAVTKP